MRNALDATERPETVVGLNSVGVTKRRLVFTVSIIFLIWAVTLFNSRRAAAVPDDLTAWPTPSSPDPLTLAQDYSKFSHKSPAAHEDFAKPDKCGSCHRRKASSLVPKFPAHKDCTGCHLVQFTNPTASNNPICTICHTRDGLNLTNPPTKSFPRLRSFTAEFDHAQHLQGIESARPAEGCAGCHALANRGVAEAIPARLNAHQVCYECHSPGRQASDSSSCGSCHRLGRYSPTSMAARSYRVGFSHVDHGPRQRLTCESCHNVLGRGLPQARQVSSISPALHHSSVRARSCMTCHNGQRAFGDTRPEFNDCKRCHKGPTFKS
jgi:c(7)-type cytochrome triheme protein